MARRAKSMTQAEGRGEPRAAEGWTARRAESGRQERDGSDSPDIWRWRREKLKAVSNGKKRRKPGELFQSSGGESGEKIQEQSSAGGTARRSECSRGKMARRFESFDGKKGRKR